MKVILSCTTTYERQDIFYYGLQSLLSQTLKPDLFLLNISKESYLQDSGFSELPDWLKDKRIIVNWVKNTGSYRKLLPALENASDEDLIIPCDDDILYGENWLEQLVRARDKEPGAIICSRARKMEKNRLNRWKNYSQWRILKSQEKGFHVLPTNGSGAVFTKKLLDINFLSDPEFMELAPTTDDLWFKMASLKKNVPVAVFPQIDEDNVYLIHNHGLENYNLGSRSSGSLFQRVGYRIWVKATDSLGVNRTPNDIAWDKIVAYAETEYGFDPQV
jgi:glycosyltransferase involved in cell wall biosynthesis